MNKVSLKKIKLGFLLVVVLTACNSREVFFEYSTVNTSGWSKDSVYSFDVTIDDVSVPYNIYVNTRHSSQYPYQNLWLFIYKSEKSAIATKDTINFYLADQFGKWLGDGVGDLYSMPVLYQQNVKFPKKGNYRYQIGHGMRDSVLIGVSDIGIKIEKAE